MINVKIEDKQTKFLRETKWIRAKMSGLFNCVKSYGSRIQKGETLGSISDPFGDTEVPLKAPETGYIVGINNQPVINEGDALIHVGME